jgi:hypothetical protein
MVSSFLCSSAATPHRIYPSSVHAQLSRPLKRVAHPSTLSLEIVPRNPISLPSSAHRRHIPSPNPNTLRYDDSFRLILSAFNETFFLHLRPNDDLIHPQARINYYDVGLDGRSVITHSEPLLRETVKAYWGEAVAAHHSHTRMREDAAHIIPDPNHPNNLGWARIMIHDQGDADADVAPDYEGSFSVRGDTYHITTLDYFLRTKHELDNENIEVINSSLDSNLVIWRQSDMMTPEEHIFAETGIKPEAVVPPHHGCGHDRLEFNTNPLLNPLLRTSKVPYTRWYDNPFRFLRNNDSLIPRGDIQSSGNMPSNE